MAIRNMDLCKKGITTWTNCQHIVHESTGMNKIILL